MSATIYLIRHGETTWNRNGRLQGQADSPLTLHGTKQIEAVGRTLHELTKSESFDVWASPLGRTRQSASIISDILGFEYENIKFDSCLKEITLGDRDGYSSWAALMVDFPKDMALRKKDPWNYKHPNGESSQMVHDRLAPFIQNLEDINGTHVIISHGVVSKIVRGLYLNLSNKETFALDRPQEAFHCLKDGHIITIKVDLI
jgi:broad specificity phosphatase PhoE